MPLISKYRNGPETLEQVLADELEDAAVLRRNGHTEDADMIERIITRIRGAAEDYLLFLSEAAARLRSNHAISWLRSRFPAWEMEGHAYKKDGTRYYRAVVIPQRNHPSVAREAGRAAGREASAT